MKQACKWYCVVLIILHELGVFGTMWIPQCKQAYPGTLRPKDYTGQIYFDWDGGK